MWFKSLLVRLRHPSKLFQLLIYLFCALMITWSALVHFLGPLTLLKRGATVSTVAELLLMEGLNAKNGIFRKLRPFLEAEGIEVWLVDEAGRVISSSESLPSLPVDFAEIPKPMELLQTEWRKVPPTILENLASFRAGSNPDRYLVVLFSKDSPTVAPFIITFFIYSFWLMGITAVGVLLLLPGKQIPPVIATLDNQKGFSLLGALVALVILSIAMVGLQKVLTLSFRGAAQSDLKMAIRSLSGSIQNEVDCQKTFEGVNLATTCAVGLGKPKPLTLKNAKGLPIGEPIANPLIDMDPLEASLNGAGKIGGFYVRAYCDSAEGNLVVRFAKVKTVVGRAVTFATDPILKRPLDWSDSASNPLFGPVDRNLCKGTASSVPGELNWVPFRCAFRLPVAFGGVVGGACPSFQCAIPGNVSPDNYCKILGYKGTTNACKGVSAVGGYPFQGSLTAHRMPHPTYNPTSAWVTGCWFSNPCMDVPDFIQCY